MMKRIGFNKKAVPTEAEIGQLLDKYFDGLTSGAEEDRLCRYFATAKLPEQWEHLRPLFGYVSCRRAVDGRFLSDTRKLATRNLLSRRILWSVGGASVAAAIALTIALRSPHVADQPLPTTGSFAVVNGERVNDPDLVRLYAKEAFDAVSIDREELAQELFDL
ncbi:hypothetical protein CLI76_04525 [Porphyromonas gingivalis]|uniref:hypothetical protein n=2 Tax=Porphyromonas gingivalis TaxID=837 RepID=UPI000BE71746|nr:hypothetical protein [Porphyromonas gingivalis]ATS00690.1 hypothetical protein CS549_06210 [Porphyromonas gingivalis]PDP77357.1 hypothetical protein CLI76_04525 [Porphyromonas gingivalis]